jgi:RNA polymerase sigma-70 factor (ECF subfamily)
VNNSDLAAQFEAVFRAHHRAVLSYALRRCDPDTAQDVVADTFLVCWRRIDQVPADARPWLFGVARRSIANRRRSAARTRSLNERVAGAADGAHGRDPDELLSERNTIRAAYARLSERDRELLSLVAWDGLDHAAAARALGCTRATFTVRLHRARRRLAARLEEPDAAQVAGTTPIEDPT